MLIIKDSITLPLVSFLFALSRAGVESNTLWFTWLMVVTRLWKPSDTQYAHSIRAVYLSTVMMCNTVSELTWLIREIIACRIVGSFMRGLRWPRTQSTEREEAWQRPQPVLVTMGLMLHLRHHTIIHPRSLTNSLTCIRTSTFTTTYLGKKLQRSHAYYACVAPVIRSIY